MSRRVRYSRQADRSPRNTLVTTQEGDTIYFGIARCNTREDRFSRKVGQRIADNRVGLAQDDSSSVRDRLAGTELVIDSSGLYGSVPASNVRELVRYFRDIDTLSLRRR